MLRTGFRTHWTENTTWTGSRDDTSSKTSVLKQICRIFMHFEEDKDIVDLFPKIFQPLFVLRYIYVHSSWQLCSRIAHIRRREGISHIHTQRSFSCCSHHLISCLSSAYSLVLFLLLHHSTPAQLCCNWSRPGEEWLSPRPSLLKHPSSLLQLSTARELTAPPRARLERLVNIWKSCLGNPT